MTAAPIHFRDERLMLDPTGAAFWPAKRVLIVADLSLERLSSIAVSPMSAADPRVAFERLLRLVRLYRPSKIILLGAQTGARFSPRRIHQDDKARLEAIAREAPFIWVSAGEHEPGVLPGQFVHVHREGPFIFRHEATPQLGPREIEISGFHRPKASIAARARRVSRPCFVADARRLVLPAFAGAAEGADVRDQPIARLFPRGLRVFLLGQEQLFSFALEQLGRVAEVA
ncbi:phosphoesterase [Acidocella sp.]|uniref:phosphoesterase n=1 Tax=Acidocella sp. TaxID=50710 RepID=UPI0026087209|nr:phosphoesterase [Acidocella sp.]